MKKRVERRREEPTRRPTGRNTFGERSVWTSKPKPNKMKTDKCFPTELLSNLNKSAEFREFIPRKVSLFPKEKLIRTRLSEPTGQIVGQQIASLHYNNLSVFGERRILRGSHFSKQYFVNEITELILNSQKSAERTSKHQQSKKNNC